MVQLTLINVTGEDKPGMTSAIASLLAGYDVDVLDIGQAVIHDHLTLGILISVSGDQQDVFDALEKHANDVGVRIRFSPVGTDRYEEWVNQQGRSRFILTLLGRRIRAQHIASVSDLIASHNLNIDNISRLSGRVPLVHETSMTRACVEFSLRGTPGDTFRQELMVIAAEMDVDIAVQEDTIFRRNRRLVVFDMDSTLISTEVIDELAICAGVGEEVSNVTESAMRGELDFRESLRKRVSLLKGLPASELQTVADRLPLMEGAEHLFEMLNKLGYKTAILSGGFTYFGKVLQEKLKIDHMYANELEIENGVLTGQVLEPIVDADRKANLLRELAANQQISLEQTIAVGDGANDLAMLGIAGLGIAFHAKPIVKENAEQSISTLGLDSILYLMGIRDRDRVS